MAAIVTLAGMQWKDQSHCGPSSPVSVLHVHGRNDETIKYDGGTTPNGASYPGAVETVGDWAAQNGCTGSLAATGRRLDLDRAVAGDETVEEAYTGCPAGTDIQLWTIERGGHVPAFNEHWAEAIWAFMANHPKAANRSPVAGTQADTFAGKRPRSAETRWVQPRWPAAHAAFGRSTPWLPWFSWS